MALDAGGSLQGVPGPFGLSRAVLHRARAEWPVVAAAFLLLLAATTLLAAGALYAETVAVAAVRRALLDVPPTERAIDVRVTSGPDLIAELDARIRPEIERAIVEPGGEVILAIRSGTFADAETPPRDVTDLTLLTALEGLDRHAQLTAGRWAEAGHAPIEATLSEDAAAALGLAVGDGISLVNRLDEEVGVDLVVTGMWRPDPDDLFFLLDPLELTGEVVGAQFTTRGPFVVARDDLLALGGRRPMSVDWRGVPSIDGLRPARLGATATDVASLRERISAVLPPDVDPTITTRLPEILTSVERSVLVSRSGVLLLTAQFAVLAGYAVLLVAGMLAERRRTEVALLRSRGAGTGHIAAMSLLEALGLAIPTLILAPLLAVAIVAGLGAVGPLADARVVTVAGLDSSVLIVSLLAVGLGVVALTLPSLLAGGSVATVRAAQGRPDGRTLAQRLGIDIALVVVAAIALWQLRLYGAPLTQGARGVLGIDPLLVAAPAIGLVAGAVLAIRIVPRVAQVAERALERRRGLVSPLGARQVARRPLRYTRAALLLMLASALGTFAVAHAATWSRSQADQAAYQAAADVRIVDAGFAGIPGWAVGSMLLAVDGVGSASPVVRQTLDVGRAIRDGQLLAIDPATVGPMVTLPPGSRTAAAPDASTLLAPLAAARWSTPGVPLPGTPRRIAVELSSDLGIPPDQVQPGEPPPIGGGITAAVVLSGGDGRLHRFAGEPVRLAVDGRRIEIPLALTDDDSGFAAAGPTALEAVELTIAAPVFTNVVGTVELGDVLVSDESAGGDWTPLGFDAGADDWSWSRVESASFGTSGRFDPPTDAPGRIELRAPDFEPGAPFPAPDPSWPISGSPSDPPPVFRLAASPRPPAPAGDGRGEGAIAAVVNPAFVLASGAEVGERLIGSSFGQDLSLEIVGVVDAFPPLDPSDPFAIVDLSTFDRIRFAEDGQIALTGEWWLAVDESAADQVVARLAEPPFEATEVVERLGLTRALSSDPIPLGVIGALGLGAVAALAFAAIGFVVSAAVSTDERLSEFALLQALGLSTRQLSAWLSIEHAFLLGTGLLSGMVIGVLLAWLVLPFATLTASGAATVPAPVIVLPIEPFVPLAVMAIGLLAGTVALVVRQLRRVELAGVLRAQDG
jgi:hypothetical protein